MRLPRAIAGNAKAATGAALLLVFAILAAVPGLFAHDSPTAQVYDKNLGASAAHLLGTTGLGQDTFAQAVYGTRPVLEIAFGAGLASTLIAALIGVAAAYLGGFWDALLSLFTDIVLVIPLFPLLIVIAAYVRSSNAGVMIAVLTFTGWSYTARQLRSHALALRGRDFLAAARVRGERAGYIIVVEILPTMSSLLVAAFLTNALYDVLFASGLQFIGLGDPNATGWGTMLYWAQNNEALQAGFYLQAIVPGAAIALLGAAFALLNYAFDEIGSPALRPVRNRRSPGRMPIRRPPTWERDPPALEVAGLSVEYAARRGSPIRAVDDVSFTVAKGEFLAIVGESGCGKSTLLFAIARLLTDPARITGGSVTFRGDDLATLTGRQLNAFRWRHLSVVMQSAMNALNPMMTVGAQFADAMRAHGTPSRLEVRRRSTEVLRMVGVDPAHLRSYPHQLSGGMRQRTMIAMALLLTPDLVIMDEPTSALDVVAQRSLMVRIKELQAELGFAVVFVTHDLSLVSHFSDRLLVMYAGQVAELGPTREVFDHPRHPYSRGLLDAFPAIRGPKVPLAGIPGAHPDLSLLPSACRFLSRCPRAVDECSMRVPDLTDKDGTLVRCLNTF